MEETYKQDLLLLATHSEFARKYAFDKETYETKCLVKRLNERVKDLSNLFGWYDDNVADPTDYFHPINSGCIILDDDYLFGIRCNHLIWIDYYDLDSLKTLLIGNHKGATQFRVIEYTDTCDEIESFD